MQMENEFILSYKMACDWWRRANLQPKPKNMERVVEVLQQAEIKIYSSNFSSDGWLVCEPRPAAIYEALSGKIWDSKQEKFSNYSKEEPGRVLEILADKGICF